VVAKKAAPKKAVKKVVAKPVAKAPVKKALVKKVVAQKAAVKPVAKPVTKALPAKSIKAETKPVEVKKAPEVKKPAPVVKKESAPVKSEAPVSKVEANKEFKKPAPVAKMQEANNDDRNRYSDAELKEFKDLILKKLESARTEYNAIAESIQSIENTGYLTLEDGSTTEEKERLSQMAARQKKYIENLENALIRIENKTYGICKVTGKLISKERLRAVPHTTQSIEAKLQQYK
jgi:RNA polymerase-binding transcription factor DksA